jgi:hypothetical protein
MVLHQEMAGLRREIRELKEIFRANPPQPSTAGTDKT